MILSMATPLDTLEEWLNKAKVFHGHKLRIDDLRSGNRSYTFCSNQTSSSYQPCDPNTMEVDFVKLKKLNPQEQAKCMREGHCFKCRKTGHNTNNCRSSRRPQQNPNSPQASQQVRHAEDVPDTPTPDTPTPDTPTPVKTASVSTFSAYAQSLGKLENELLQTLRMCYKEPDEEVRVASTFESDKEGFKTGNCFNIIFL